MPDMMATEGTEESGRGRRLPEIVPVPPPDRALPDKLDRALNATKAERKQRHWVAAVLTSRRFWFVVFLLAVIGAAIAIPWYYWRSAPEINLNIAILDKTVPFTDHREHRGLFWLLGQNKFTDDTIRSEGRWYDLEQDYIGFYPPDPETIEIEEQESEPEMTMGAVAFAAEAEESGRAQDNGYVFPEDDEELVVRGDWRAELLTVEDLLDRDVLYIADTYGVYTADYLERAGHDVDQNDMIFGGLDESEVEAAEWFAEQGRLIMGEFNSFASPTPEDLRLRLEHVFGVRWLGWSGRFFVNFADKTDVPYWLLDEWETANNREWDLEGPGYVLVEDATGEYIILEGEKHIGPRGVEMVPREQFVSLDVMQGVKPCTFCYWFDIVEAEEGVETLADFDMHLTLAGTNLLRAHDLPSAFPAVTRKRAVYRSLEQEANGSTEQIAEELGIDMANRRDQRRAVIRSGDWEYLAYYMAGNMMDFKMDMGPHNTRLTMYINRSFYGQPVVGSQGYFFWHTYYPMVSNILRAEANRLTGKPSNVYLFK
jgi:hypothetical protein